MRLAPCLARTEAFRVELTATGWKTTSHILKLLPQGFQWPHPRLHRAEWNGFLYALQTKNPKQMPGETTVVEQIFIFGVASPYDPLCIWSAWQGYRLAETSFAQTNPNNQKLMG